MKSRHMDFIRTVIILVFVIEIFGLSAPLQYTDTQIHDFSLFNIPLVINSTAFCR